MARRALASVLVALGLVAASLAWWGFTLQRTVFDADRSDRLAHALLDSGAVQDALISASTDALDAALPAQVRAQVPMADLTTAARAALDTPEARAALEQALVGTHRYLIGDVDQPPTLDTAPIDAALRAQIARVRPDLAEVVPSLPPLQVDLPDSGLPVVRDIRRLVDRATATAEVVAVVALAAALIVAPDRAPVLRRVGWWATLAGGLWVALRFAVPALAEVVVPARAALIAGLVEAGAEGMAAPGLWLAALGLLALVLGLVLPRRTIALGAGGRAARRRAAERRAAKASRRDPRLVGGRDGGRASRPGTAPAAGRAVAPGAGPLPWPSTGPIGSGSGPGAQRVPPGGAYGPTPAETVRRFDAARTAPLPVVGGGFGATAPGAGRGPGASGTPTGPGGTARWVEGVGYVRADEGSDEQFDGRTFDGKPFDDKTFDDKTFDDRTFDDRTFDADRLEGRRRGPFAGPLSGDVEAG
jgi:hypothetical protein